MGKYRLTSIALSLLTLVGVSQAAQTEPPPLEAYAGMPAIAAPRLSPDGSAVAMISPVKGKPTLIVRWLDSDKTSTVSTENATPVWFEWKTSNRLIVSVRKVADTKARVRIAVSRMLMIDADGGKPRWLELNRELGPGERGVGNLGNRVPQFQDEVVSMLPQDPDHLLVALTPQTDRVHPEVRQVDVATGLTRVVVPRRADVTGWIADPTGVVRADLKIGSEEWGGRIRHRWVEVRDTADGDWTPVYDADVEGPRFTPLGFSAQAPNLMYVLADDDKGLQVARQFDITTKQFVATVQADPACDVKAVFAGWQLVGFTTPCRDNAVAYLDGAWQSDRDNVKSILKADTVFVLDRSVDGKRTLLSVRQTATAPTSYWLYDHRGAKPVLQQLEKAYPHIPSDQIAETRVVSYPARDGLTIPAFLTVPVSGSGPQAFVILPHDGPSAADSGRFDWRVQYLVSRGYGVFQPQYRGSTGMGKAFRNAGLQQWGLAMQDDLSDGTRWLIAQGLADPKRICIAGEHYGGYAALMGAVREPDLYACAASFGAISDLGLYVRELWQYFAFRDINVPRIRAANEPIDAISPIDNVVKIKVPVLLVHGYGDARVDVAQSESMERALKSAGKSVSAVYLDDSDGKLDTGEDRIAWLTALDKFLAANLKN